MPQPQTAAGKVRFGPFTIDRDSGELFKNAIRIKLQDQPFQILCILLEQPGRVVTREELQNRVWHADTFVEFDQGLYSAVRRLRDALCDSAEAPRYVETLARRGYRFIAPVEHDGPVAIRPAGLPAPGVIPVATSSVGEQVSAAESVLVQPFTWLGRIRLWQPAAVGAVLLVLGVGTAWLLRPMVLPEMAARRITANPPDAPVTGAMISPDGKYVAYSDPTGVYIRHIDSGETRPLALPKGFDGIPTSWFPDSTHLLLANHEGPQHRAKIWRVSILGGDPQMLLENADLGVVSPDGSRIAFFRGSLPSGGRLPARELWLADADGQNLHRLVAQEPDRTGTTQSDMWSASWSPDGQRVAYIQRETVPSNFPNGDRYLLYTRNADGSDVRFVLQNNRMDSVLDEYGLLLPPPLYWAPDGRLYFALKSQPKVGSQEYAIWSIAVDQSTGEPQGQPRELLGGLGSISGFSASRAGTGKRLVFWRSDVSVQVFVSEFNHNTRKMNAPRRLTLDQSVDAVPLDWTADSKAIVIASERDGKPGVYKQRLDETTPEPLTQVRQHQAIAPRLSGDGSEVLYAQAEKPDDPSAPVSLMAVPITGGTPRLILSEPGINNVLCAKPPVQMCILKEWFGQIDLFYILDLNHGKGRLVAKLPSNVDWGFSPDGSTLVMVTNAEEGKVRFVSIDSGTTKDVVVQDWPILKSADWTVDSKVVLMASVTAKGVPVILGVDTEGNAKVLLEGERGNPLEWVIPSPDGKYGALAVTTGESNVWMVPNY